MPLLQTSILDKLSQRYKDFKKSMRLHIGGLKINWNGVEIHRIDDKKEA